MPGQRHVGDGDGRAHGLQHRIRFDACEQPAPLSQDGVTVGWLLGESFIVDHARRSVVPERLCDILLQRTENFISPREYYEFSHFTDALMSDQEILELPKVWVVGGDGGMGDIGYQNTSKVILQNRPNVKALMLDTQVYSNTGGQNSDSTRMLGAVQMRLMELDVDPGHDCEPGFSKASGV